MPNCSQNLKRSQGEKSLPALSSEPNASLLQEQGCSWLLYVNTEEGDPNRTPKERIQNFKRQRHGNNKEREQGQEQRLNVPG